MPPARCYDPRMRIRWIAFWPNMPISLAAILPRGEEMPAAFAGIAESGVIRLTPARHGTDGFFAAILERR